MSIIQETSTVNFSLIKQIQPDLGQQKNFLAAVHSYQAKKIMPGIDFKLL